FLTSLLIVGLALPVWVLLGVGAFTGNPVFGWIALVVGCLYGGAMLWVGVRLGGAWYDKRAPELYQDLARLR
ncbi:MAG: hypothetical protein L0G46_05905, partial [Kocuria sp.]|nr:hypothetical protein [Kocuria sp.]